MDGTIWRNDLIDDRSDLIDTHNRGCALGEHFYIRTIIKPLEYGSAGEGYMKSSIVTLSFTCRRCGHHFVETHFR